MSGNLFARMVVWGAVASGSWRRAVAKACVDRVRLRGALSKSPQIKESHALPAGSGQAQKPKKHISLQGYDVADHVCENCFPRCSQTEQGRSEKLLRPWQVKVAKPYNLKRERSAFERCQRRAHLHHVGRLELLLPVPA